MTVSCKSKCPDENQDLCDKGADHCGEENKVLVSNYCSLATIRTIQGKTRSPTMNTFGSGSLSSSLRSMKKVRLAPQLSDKREMTMERTMLGRN